MNEKYDKPPIKFATRRGIPMKRLMTIIISAPIRNIRGFCPFLIP